MRSFVKTSAFIGVAALLAMPADATSTTSARDGHDGSGAASLRSIALGDDRSCVSYVYESEAPSACGKASGRVKML